ncbi:hypothetical protein GGS21DRAFT_521545 [Xylaria nigripes]|nr:hypothetical protein GGS21DRAFT_521545 [Xylaria nigripes]
MPFSGFDDPLGLSTSTDMSTSNWEPPQQDHEAGIVNYTGFPPAAVQGEPHLGMVATTDTNKCYVRQRWVKDSNGNIILPDAVQPQLIEAGLTNVHKTVLCAEVIAQRQQVASLVMVGRHLDAFCLALDFAKEDARGAGFYAQIYMFDYSPDMIIPGIDIMMHKWRHDPVISSYLAYYLLRGMRLRYGRLAFPDRVDMHEYGGGRARILIPYGIDNPANPESVRVRKNIVSQFTERWLSFCNGPATI